MDFGFNIGTEFGGRHPAIILKQIKQINQIVVIPLDSPSDIPDTESKRENSEFWVKISEDEIRGMTNQIRWVNVYNVTQISVLRVDFLDNEGNIKYFPVDYEVLDRIDEKIKKFGYNSFQKKLKTPLTNKK